MIGTRMSRFPPRRPAGPGGSADLRVAGPLQPHRAVAGRALCFAVLALAAPGCLLVDPIASPPAFDIQLVTPDPSGHVRRGDPITLEAVGHDPGRSIDYRWQSFACADAPDHCATIPPAHCDTVAFHTSTQDMDSYTVPEQRADGSPVQVVCVRLDGTDTRGATAAPQRLEIPLDDRPPTVEVSPHTASVVQGTSLPIFATVDDPDDAASALAVTWQVFPPAGQATYTLDPYTGTLPPGQLGKVLRPTDADTSLGAWDVRVTATDPLGMTASADTVANVVADAPPCLGQWQPIAAPAPDALPIAEPTLFQVDRVSDDLDPYPASATGVTTFVWSLEGPGDTSHVVLAGATGNSVALDPATYQPGDIVELRVEISDRKHAPPTQQCPDASPTCSLTGDSCEQRLTWRVEIR